MSLTSADVTPDPDDRVPTVDDAEPDDANESDWPDLDTGRRDPL